MVQYNYDAWGNQQVLDATGNAITDTTNIGILNPFRYRSYYFDNETGLYYLQTRYYDPEVGRFLNIDSLDYADPETINGLNLFAYCDNNPVMNTDPNGTWAWLRALPVMAVAVLAVAAIAAVTVATGGSALPVVVGAAVGAGTNAVVSAGTQMLTTGSIDVSQLLVDTSIGSVSGAFGGSALGTVGMTIAGGVTDFAGSVAGDWVAGDNINWVGAIASAGLGALTSATFGAGAQKGKLGDRRAALSTRKSIKSRGPNGYRHITNYKFALASNKSRLTKVTKNSNRGAIAEIFSGIPDSFTITVYSFLALAKL